MTIIIRMMMHITAFLLVHVFSCALAQVPGSNNQRGVSNFINSRNRIPPPLLTAELLDYRKQLLYDYNLTDFTDITAGKSIHDQPLPFRLPFFGFEFNYVYIQRDGYLAFNKGLLSYKFPLKLPFSPTDSMIQEDPSVIAPWFALQDIADGVTKAGVYLRIVNIAEEKNATLRDRLILDFREGMIGAADFQPKYALIITWRNMTMINRRPERPLKTNTYQAVIATDEIRAYAMFNYEKIEWITHTDNYDGLKGPPAFIGFNAGNTTRAYEFRPYSQNPRVSLMTQLGFGNGLLGRFFFQIDEEVWPGACIDKDLDPNLPDRLPLTFFPRYGHMLGGTMVNITGPCLSPSSIISCKFENWRVDGIYRDENHATCISPPVLYHGYVDLTVSVDDRTLFLGRFYMQPPEVADESIVVIGDTDREERPRELRFKWNPNKLPSFDANAIITVSLWGYRETSDLYPSLTYIDVLAEGVRLSQSEYTLQLDTFNQRDNRDLLDITFGFIAINITNPGGRTSLQQVSPTIWSRTMPLSWYFWPQWSYWFGDWKYKFCAAWYEKESFADRFATTVFRCPCTRQQALLDKGRFSPDLECNIVDRKCDTFHRGALACFRSGRPSVGGSGQKCCYDDYDELIQTSDTMYGGRPARAFIYGKHPYKMRMMIPALSTWLHDEMPFFFCCKWQANEDNADTCQMYNYWRTSQDCSSYQPPAVASVYGDPHFLTFDGTNYTFNGKGEFSLVHVDTAVHKLDVQARFEQVPKHMRGDAEIPATFLTAIAARDNQSSVVEFRVRPGAARWRYHMYVIVDKEYVFFWDDSLRVQNFKGVTLYQPAGIQNMSHIIAMFDSGAGVEVMSTQGRMMVHTYLPVTFRNSTGGLLGFYNKERVDDLQLPAAEAGTGQVISPNAPLEDLHRRFGQSWRLLEGTYQRGKGSSLFWHSPVTFAHYDDVAFNPDYTMPPILPEEYRHLEPQLQEVCGSDSSACLYDFVVTRDPEFAKITKSHDTWARSAWYQSNRTVIRCPALSKPLHGRKSENRYWAGTIVRFSCDDGYRLVGYENRRCRADGLWSWGEDAQCVPTSLYRGTVAGVSLGIALPLLLIVAATVFCIIRSNRQEKHHYTGEPGEDKLFQEWPGDPMVKSNPMINDRDSPISDTPSGRAIAEIATTAREAEL